MITTLDNNKYGFEMFVVDSSLLNHFSLNVFYFTKSSCLAFTHISICISLFLGDLNIAYFGRLL